MRDIKRDIAQAPVHVGSKADNAVLEHLLRELSAAEESPTVRRTRTGPHLRGLLAYAASAAIILGVVAWLLYGGRAPESHPSAQVTSASTSGLVLLTELSLERAFRHGGIPAVEAQSQKALAPAGKRAAPSIDELLAELAGTGKNTGGTRS